LEHGKVGVVIKDFDEYGRKTAVDALLTLCADTDVRQRCVRVASRHFSLDEGAAAYDRIYRELLATQ